MMYEVSGVMYVVCGHVSKSTSVYSMLLCVLHRHNSGGGIKFVLARLESLSRG